jgi:hypothetical protein
MQDLQHELMKALYKNVKYKHHLYTRLHNCKKRLLAYS